MFVAVGRMLARVSYLFDGSNQSNKCPNKSVESNKSIVKQKCWVKSWIQPKKVSSQKQTLANKASPTSFYIAKPSSLWAYISKTLLLHRFVLQSFAKFGWKKLWFCKIAEKRTLSSNRSQFSKQHLQNPVLLSELSFSSPFGAVDLGRYERYLEGQQPHK